MNNQDLTKQVRELKELKQLKEELEAQITEIEDSIKAEMTERNVAEMVVDVFKIKWTPVKSNRFDTTAFKKEYSKLYEQFIKVIETKRFSIA